MNTTSADAYLRDGCGRCDNYRTPQCKVLLWTEALVALRALVRETGLVEEMKWGSPCYALDGKNVVMLTAFKESCALSFFKGALLADEARALEAPGPNSQAMRLLRFRSAAEVAERRALAASYLAEAMALERAGATIAFREAPEPVPAELQAVLDADPLVAAAFEALTPGRQRSYVLQVSGAKQAATRASRAEKCVPKILSGKGFNER